MLRAETKRRYLSVLTVLVTVTDVDTAVTSPCPLLADLIPKAPVFPNTHLGPLLQRTIKIKRLRVRSSHIVNLKADVELREVR